LSDKKFKKLFKKNINKLCCLRIQRYFYPLFIISLNKNNMKKLALNTAIACIALASLTSCDNDDETIMDSQNQINKSDVISNYATIALANYQAALNDAITLETAINVFTSNPSLTTFNTAKSSWLSARESYGTSEAFRFANGPIDTGETDYIEGYLNSWPMDEAYVDYVEGASSSGIINDLVTFPLLSKEILSGLNPSDDNGVAETEVAIGYHAIEFLLWGQDLTAPSQNMSGQRPHTDFVDSGTADNQDRRRQYLNICADLLTDHLQIIVDQWNGTYMTTFLGLSDNTAIDNMISSIAELSRSELAIERMSVALVNQDQEDEHSCFSDNTHRDIRLNLRGVANIYNGTYDAINGISLASLVAQESPALGTELTTLLDNAISALDNTAIPFDLAITGGAESSEGAKVQTAVLALVAFGDKLLEAKVALGIN
jgi:putative iron-regulated protein